MPCLLLGLLVAQLVPTVRLGITLQEAASRRPDALDDGVNDKGLLIAARGSSIRFECVGDSVSETLVSG